MEILEGHLPKGKLWRTLVLLSPDHEPGLAWQLGMQVAQGHAGEIVAAIILSHHAPEQVEAARAVFEEARTLAEQGADVYAVLVEAVDIKAAVLSIVMRADIDLVIADGERPEWQALEHMPVPVAVVRGAAYMQYHEQMGGEKESLPPIEKILVPTAGGPNTAVALSFLLPLAPSVEITTLYVVREYLGQEEEAHGRSRLRQLTQFVDGQELLESKVVYAPSATAGIVSEASGLYDLVVIGATRENTLARAVFGDVVGSVLRESRTPVVVFREGSGTIGNVARNLAWSAQKVIPRLELGQRTEVYTRVRRSARPDTDFFVLIGLSALIAALGLMLNSAAVVIGAMLVAPLMSPIVGAGLAIVMGNLRFMRLSLEAIVRGALLAIFLSLLLGLVRPDEPLTPEILARTEPTLLDLGVALFAGLAGAYALTHSEAAAALPGVAISAALVPPLSAIGISLASRAYTEAMGATLLFVTNLIAIVAAAVLVFVVVGFRPAHWRKAEREVQRRTVRFAIGFLLIITVLLGVTTYRLVEESQLRSRIQEITEASVAAIDGAELDTVTPEHLGDATAPLLLEITVRTTRPIPYARVERLRNDIATELAPYIGPEREIALSLTVIDVTRLDPAVPPTPTATATPIPAPTATLTPTATPTVRPTITPTVTATPFRPPLDAPSAIVESLDGLDLHETAGYDSAVIAHIPSGAAVIVLEGEATVNGQRWRRVASEGRVGWVPAIFLKVADGN